MEILTAVLVYEKVKNMTRKKLIIVIVIVILFFLFVGGASADPPPSILKINGNEQTSGIGTNCWREENQTGYLCSDMIGFITPTEPLLTGSPFTAHLLFTLQEPPEEAGLSAIRVTDDDELKVAAYGTRAWRLTPEHIEQFQINGNYSKKYKLPSERESEINLSLEPALYVLTVDATWKDKGSASYGFLVKVYDSAAEVISQASSTTKSAKSGTSSPNEEHNISPTEKVAGFELVLTITMLLTVYTARRKRK